MPRRQRKKSANNEAIDRITSKSSQVGALSAVLMAVRAKRFEIDQSGVVLTSQQREQLGRDYDIARDAYYQGLSALIDSNEPALVGLLEEISASRSSLEALAVSQQNALAVIDAIGGLVGLAARLLVLGSA